MDSVSETLFLNKNWTMDNVQKTNNGINMPSSQTFRSKGYELGGTCNTHVAQECVQDFGRKTKGKGHLERQRGRLENNI
jgi:hypothetical protein